MNFEVSVYINLVCFTLLILDQVTPLKYGWTRRFNMQLTQMPAAGR